MLLGSHGRWERNGLGTEGVSPPRCRLGSGPLPSAIDR